MLLNNKYFHLIIFIRTSVGSAFRLINSDNAPIYPQNTSLFLSSLLPHTPSLHPFHPLTESCLNNLPLLTLLRVFKVTLMTQFHKVSRFVHFTFEPTKCRLDWFAFSYGYLDVNIKGSGGSCSYIFEKQRWVYVESRGG